ncbi:hypothetical protein LXL04_028119 [Taraxacum kok-saghyz]
MLPFVLEATIVTGTSIGQRVYIPRIKFIHKSPDLPFDFVRKQYPLRVCYAMTINKSQGQSLEKIGVYLPQPVFSHGQLYVALSRATSPESIKALIVDENNQQTNKTKNIVFQSLLREVTTIEATRISDLGYGCAGDSLHIRILRKWTPFYRKEETWFFAVDKFGDAVLILGEKPNQRLVESKLDLFSCFEIEDYTCSETRGYMKIIMNPIHLNLGMASKILPIPENEDIPKYWFCFASMERLAQPLKPNDDLPGLISYKFVEYIFTFNAYKVMGLLYVLTPSFYEIDVIGFLKNITKLSKGDGQPYARLELTHEIKELFHADRPLVRTIPLRCIYLRHLHTEAIPAVPKAIPQGRECCTIVKICYGGKSWRSRGICNTRLSFRIVDLQLRVFREQGLILAALLGLSAFFSMAETSITTLSPWKVRELAEKEDENGVFKLLRTDITQFLTTILIGTTVVNIGATALFTEAATTVFGEAGVSAATGVMTVVVLLLTEITPKSIAVHNATAVARDVARPVAWLSIVLYQVGRVVTFLSMGMLKILGLKGKIEPSVTEDELKLMLRVANLSGAIEEEEQDMIENVLEIKDTHVKEVMTPLVDVVAVDFGATLLDFHHLWVTNQYSRVPVFEQRIDNIVGVAYAMDLLDLVQKGEMLETAVVGEIAHKPAYFVLDSVLVWNLLREFHIRKVHMAVVLNEYGGTVGIVTLEDVVEEIVGEIFDENDSKEETDRKNREYCKGMWILYYDAYQYYYWFLVFRMWQHRLPILGKFPKFFTRLHAILARFEAFVGPGSQGCINMVLNMVLDPPHEYWFLRLPEDTLLQSQTSITPIAIASLLELSYEEAKVLTKYLHFVRENPLLLTEFFNISLTMIVGTLFTAVNVTNICLGKPKTGFVSHMVFQKKSKFWYAKSYYIYSMCANIVDSTADFAPFISDETIKRICGFPCQHFVLDEGYDDRSSFPPIFNKFHDTRHFFHLQLTKWATIKNIQFVVTEVRQNQQAQVTTSTVLRTPETLSQTISAEIMEENKTPSSTSHSYTRKRLTSISKGCFRNMIIYNTKRVSQYNTFSANHLYHILSRMKILYHKYDSFLKNAKCDFMVFILKRIWYK